MYGYTVQYCLVSNLSNCGQVQVLRSRRSQRQDGIPRNGKQRNENEAKK